MPRPDRVDDWHEVLTSAAALRLGLYEAIDLHGRPEAAATQLGLDPRAARVVCAALADRGHLAEQDGRWSLTPRGRELVDPDRAGADPAGDLFLTERAILAHTRLAETLAGGRKVDEVSAGDPAERRRFMRAMRHVASSRAPDTVAAIGPPPLGGRLLDCGGAPGTYAVALAGAGWEVTVLDLPETLELGQADLEAAGVDVIAGDMTEALPEGPWDCVYLGNVVHLFGPGAAAALLARAGASLAPGGLLAVQEVVLGRSPQGPRFAVLMLLATDAGEVYDEATYRDWMAAAGCPLERIVDLEEGWHQLLLGRRS